MTPGADDGDGYGSSHSPQNQRGGGSARLPPHNSEAERSVLGAILLNNESLHRVLETGIEARDFYRTAHQKVFEVILFLSERGEPADLVTVTAALRDRGAFEQVGGSELLTSLFEDTFAVSNVVHYARIVRDKALLRRVIDVTSRISASAFDGVEDTEAFLDDAEREIFTVADTRINKSFSSMHEILRDNIHTIEELGQRKSDVIGLSTGFNDFDILTSGLRPGQLIILAARPAMGKTSLFLSCAQHMATSSKAVVAIFSLEMSKEELGFRMLSMLSRIDSKRLKIGRISTQEDWARLARAADQLSRSKIFIDDSGDLTVMDIRSRCRRLVSMEKKIDLIVVDYLQLMKGSKGASKGDGSREREISEISRNLKNLGKELKVPIIALSQLNRGVESRPNKRPMLSDLRECVTGDTLVVLADGRRVPIRELVGQAPRVLAMREDGRIIEADSDRVWCTGRRKTLRIGLASGRMIQVTGKHRLYAGQGWTEARKLEPGHCLALARKLPEPASCDAWSEGRLALLGQLIGDGSYLAGQSMTHATAAEEDSRWLRELGIFGPGSHDKRVPGTVFRLSDRQIAVFVRHLWATGGKISHGVRFSTCSRGLAEDVAALLLRLGIVARIQSVHSGVERPIHMVWVRGAESQGIFLARIEATGPRVQQAEALAPALEGAVTSPQVDAPPLMLEQGDSRRRMAALRRASGGGGSSAPSRKALRGHADAVADIEHQAESDRDLCWDRIVSIGEAGVAEVYDLTVPGPASWLADGIVSHNSGAIEQDADIVCFIYRDEVYNKETEDKGIAELIVAKHRAGETSTIRLAWLAEYTLFANLAPNAPGTPIPNYSSRPEKGDITL